MDGKRFQGKTVIITGGGRGIGRATAFRFAREGADVMLIGRTIEVLDETVSAIEREGGEGLVPSRRCNGNASASRHCRCDTETLGENRRTYQ